MPQTLTFLTRLWRRFARRPVGVSIGIDHGVPGSHLIWTIENGGSEAVTLAKLIVRGHRGQVESTPLRVPHQLAPQDRLVLPTDVDWSLLNARSVAAVDVEGREYPAPGKQLAAVREQMRQAITRPTSSLSARDFLFGAADLALGVVILGLGLFMLMYAIANG